MKNRLPRRLALFLPLLISGILIWHIGRTDLSPKTKADAESRSASIPASADPVPGMGQVKEKITDNGVKPVTKEKASPRQVFKLMGASTGQPLVPGSAHVISEQIAGREVKGRTTRVDARSFAALTTVKKGEVITFPLHDQEMAQGTVDIVLKDEKGMLRVAGPLDEPANGRFCFAWNGADAAGMILLQDKKLAYLTQQDAAGNLVQEELLLSAVMCVDFSGGDAQAAASPPPAEGLPPPPPPVVPVLNSRSSATAVLYLDFDGETVTEPLWLANNTYYQPFANLTEATITDLFNRVREDYAPFDVNVTTERSRYDNAPAHHRMRCIITPDIGKVKDAVGSLGIAYLYTFATQTSLWTETVPCWVFTIDPLNGALAISHEFGHTLGLGHDNDGSADGYYGGHGGYSGPLSWSPIMGSAASRAVDQWSRGEFRSSSNNEDDLAKIASTDDSVMPSGWKANGITFVPDEDGGTRTTSAVLATSGTTANQSGVITQQTDADFFSFRTGGGTVTFSRQATADNPGLNLDIRLEILNSSGTLLAEDNPDDSLMASVSTSLAAGTYFLKVSGVGVGAPLASPPTGYTSYGSIGGYTITGSGAFAPNMPSVNSAYATSVGTTGATLGGTVVSENGAAITARGVVLSPTSTNADPYLNGSGVVNLPAGGTTGSFTLASGILSPGTQYSFRAYATNSLGTSYTMASTFKTLASLPTVTTPSVANVTGSSALLGGTVENDGGQPVTFRGVVFSYTSINPDPDVPDLFDDPPSAFLVQAGGTVGSFSAPVTGLVQGKGYSFRAFAINNEGVGYTPVRTFTTPTAPTVSSISGIGDSPYFAAMSGIVESDNGSPVIERGVYYARASVNSNPLNGATGVTKVLAATGGMAEWSIIAYAGPLLPNTTYAFRPYAANAGGIGYGPVGFVTTTSEAPFVSTGNAYPGATGAELNGMVNGYGFDTTVTFSVGTTPAYGQTVSATPSTVTSGNVSVWASLTGLSRHTTYHYRVNATSSKGTTYGLDRTFTTTNQAPVVTGKGGLHTPADTPIQVTLTGNDADGDSLTYAVSTPAGFGTVVISGNIATYTPLSGYNGSDSFQFTSSDSYGGTSAPATIGLSIGANNTPPLLAVDSPGWPSLQPVITFTGIGGGSPGANPNGGLTQGRDGHHYGTTAFGGTADLGTVFRISPAGVLTTLVHFTGSSGGSPGSYPYGGLIQGRDGNFYGTTSQGGTGNLGTIFRMTPQGALTTLVNFTGTAGSNPGANPRGGLVHGADGHFYGMTSTGGTGSTGTVFKMTAAGVLTSLVSFPAGNGINPTSGYGPEGSLIQSSDGNFYGLTPTGGANNVGTAFKLTPAGVLTTLASFDSNTGAYPQGSLVQDSAGTFYGVTWLWGDNNLGTVFSMTSTGVTTRLFSFTGTGGSYPGGRPYHGLARGRDGNFYGVTTTGGSNDWGTIFKVTPSGQFTLLSEIRGASGPLLEGSDGGLYATIWSAGGGDLGRVDRYGLAPVTVTAAEGTTATKTGTFSDAEGNATVTLTASVGTITQNNAAGTWNWSATDADGPSSSTVLITATDIAANVSQAAMTFDVTNAPPAVSAAGPATGRTGVPISFTFTATDPSQADQAAGFDWYVSYGDYTNINRPAGSLSPQVFTHTFAYPGTYQVTGTASDKNYGWSGATSPWITIQSNRAPVVRVNGAETAYSFTNAASLITPRQEHTATMLSTGKVLLVGGYGSNGYGLRVDLNTAELYDPATNTCSAAGSLGTARQSPAVSVLLNGKVLVTGGESGYSPSASVELYDPATNTWTQAANLGSGLSQHTASVLKNGKVLVTGGWGPLPTSSSQLYDPATNTWSAVAPLATARYAHSAIVLTNGKVLVTGGQGLSNPLTSSELYDPATNTWSTTGPLLTARFNPILSLLADGRVLVTGGENNGANPEIYNPQTNAWSPAGRMVDPRSRHSANVLSNGKVLVTGGFSNYNTIGGAELYDPSTNSWTALGSLVSTRLLHTAIELNNGTVLVTGGSNNGSFLSSCELISPPPPLTVTAVESSPTTQTGTFSDADGNSTVTLTASSGTVTQNNASGTWQWQAADTDGPSNSTITITARDDASQSSTALIDFVVTNSAPLISISAPLRASVGAPVNYTFSAIDASQQDQEAGFAWSVDFGDGTGQQTLPAGTPSPAALTHSFTTVGQFTARLTTTDKDGGVSTEAVHQITITAHPLLDAPEVTDITASTATLGGHVISDGGAVITERGVLYSQTSEDPDPLLGGPKVTKVPVQGTTGVFATPVTGLTPSTSYTFKAYATNTLGTSYSDVSTFTTLSNNANLSGLVLSAGTLSPSFASGTAFYTAAVSNLTDSLTVTPTAEQANAAIQVNDVIVASGQPSVPIPLNVGENEIGINVTAQDGLTSRSYSVTVIRLAPPTLGTPLAFGVSATGAELECPVTSTGGAPITQRGVVYALTGINDTPRIGGIGVTDLPDGGPDANPIAALLSGLVPGTSYSLAAYATNSEGTSYSATGTFATPSNNANLFSLSLSSPGAILTPAFSSSTTSYSATVPSTVNSISVNVGIAQENQTVTVNGVPVTGLSTFSAAVSAPISLVAGPNVISTVVTAQDGTMKTYTITVTRTVPPTVTPPTAAEVTTTGATLGGNITSTGFANLMDSGIVLAPTVTNGNPQVNGTGVIKIPGGISGGVFTVLATGLTPGVQYSFAAFADNGDPGGIAYSPVSTFTTISNDASLSNLVLSEGVLSPLFASGTTFYTASVSNVTAAITLTPTAQANATIRVNNVIVPTGSPTLPIPLMVGGNPIFITITAQDGFTSQSYSVNVTRLALPALGMPTVMGVTGFGAQLQCQVTSDGGAPVTQRGMIYAITSTNDTPRLGGTGVMESPAGGFEPQFSAFLFGLTPGTSYSFAAYATNSEGTSYSTTGTFTTPSDNADLSGLVLSAGALSPSFNSATTAYTASVSNVTDTITVTATSAQADATIRVNNVIVPTGSPSLPIPLVVGANVININVTAEDGSTLKAYTVTVTRRAPPTLGEPVASDFLSLGLGPVVRCAVTSDGGASVTQRGVVYAITSINGTPRIDGTGVTNTVMTGGDVNQIDYVFFGLTPGTSYSFVAYATNSEGTSYSSTTTFTILTPEIVMTGNGINIADGATSPALGDHTDFGSTSTAGGTATRTFAIQNTGDATLTLGPVVIGGADAASFTVNAPPPSSVPAGQSTTFQVTFDPGAPGLHSATLSFTTNDVDENPFNFSIQGTAYSSTAEVEAATWAESYGLSGADAAPTAEPFADGVPNLLKYAFNMPLTGPNVSGLAPGTGTSGLPAITVPGTGGPPDSIRVEFIRRRNSGLIYTPQYSVDGLTNFIPMTAAETVTTIDANWERVVVNQPLGLPLPTTTFSRVSVTVP